MKLIEQIDAAIERINGYCAHDLCNMEDDRTLAINQNCLEDVKMWLTGNVDGAPYLTADGVAHAYIYAEGLIKASDETAVELGLNRTED